MNSKERVLRAIGHQGTDRVPFDMFGTSLPNKERIKAFLKAGTFEEMYSMLGIDIWPVEHLKYMGEKRYYRNKEADFWGITREAYADGDSSNECPLKDISSVDDVESYQWPSPDDFYGGNLEKEINSHEDFAILGGVWAPIFHNIAWLCGFETALVNMQTQPEVTEALVMKVTDFWVGYTRRVLELGKGKIDIIENCNDFGTQSSMIMSPENFRKYFKPSLKRLYDVIKEFGVKVMQHSCGSIVHIIPDLIEIGVDIINPVQVSASGMNPEALKREFGNSITFHGAIDTQYVLPSGSIDEVRREVNRIVKILGNGGGYILSGSQGFERDIPVENIIAMYDEAKRIKL